MHDPTTRSPVTRPADLYSVSARGLLNAWHTHTAALVDAETGIEPLSPARLARHALDALAAAQALADYLMSTRWTTALDALANGAPLQDVAVAMGLEVEEVTAGLGSWADGQERIGSMTPAQRDEVNALVHGGEGR